MSNQTNETDGGEVATKATADAGGAAEKYAGLDMSASRQFPDWLAEQGVSLTFTTY